MRLSEVVELTNLFLLASYYYSHFYFTVLPNLDYEYIEHRLTIGNHIPTPLIRSWFQITHISYVSRFGLPLLRVLTRHFRQIKTTPTSPFRRAYVPPEAPSTLKYDQRPPATMVCTASRQ